MQTVLGNAAVVMLLLLWIGIFIGFLRRVCAWWIDLRWWIGNDVRFALVVAGMIVFGVAVSIAISPWL